jgi:ATP-binding cassette subfamily B protein
VDDIMTQDNQKNPKLISFFKIMKRLLGCYKPYKALLCTVSALFAVNVSLELVRPKILGNIINRLTEIGNLDQAVLSPVIYGGLLYMAIALAFAVSNYYYGVGRSRIQAGILKDIRIAIFSKIQRLSFSYHDENHSGGIITKATRDVDHMRDFFGEVLFKIAEFTTIIFGSMAIITWINWKLGLISCVLLPATAMIIGIAGKRLRVLFKKADDEYDNVTSVLQESIKGIRVVKAFGQEPQEIGKYNTKVSGFFDKIVYSVDYFAFFIPLSNSVFALNIPIVLGFGGWMVAAGTLEIGDLAACIFYLSAISRRMRMLGRIVDRTQNAVASADRIYQILDAEESIRSAEKSETPTLRGKIRFKDVWFGYSNDKPVLKGVTIEIQPGETVAFVGATGSGKSTAAHLVPRFYDVTSGQITIDGNDIRQIELKWLRNRVAMVFQEAFLFSATITENIAYGKPDSGEEEIRTAAWVAQLGQFIDSLQDGYDTIIGERGINLSGGQKQRLTIARAILMNPAILILDDCTSSVDAITEKELKSTIDGAAKGHTTIIISQRISTVRRADRVIVFSEGKVVQEGTHDELISTPGVYHNIFYNQSFEEQTPDLVEAWRAS